MTGGQEWTTTIDEEGNATAMTTLEDGTTYTWDETRQLTIDETKAATVVPFGKALIDDPMWGGGTYGDIATPEPCTAL